MKSLYKHAFLPQHCIAEEILIGIILIYPNTFSNILEKIKKEFFFLESHQLIYISLIEIYQYNQINIIELIYYLQSNELLNKVGGLRKITSIMKQSQIFVSSSKISNYVEELLYLIIQSYIKRLTIQCGHHITKIGYINNISNEYLYNKASYYLDFIKISHNKSKIISFKELISKKLLTTKCNQKDILKNNIQNLLKSGFIELDKIISGLPNGDLIIIAGRPSTGKTSLAINIIYNIFYQELISICIFSIEMTCEQILNRFISVASNIHIKSCQNSEKKKTEWKIITEICNKLLKNNIYINNKHDINLKYIEETSKDLKKNNNNIQLIIIDYLQLIELNENLILGINRSQELSYITRKLKLLAQSLKLPIIALSQLNRNIEIRNEKKPLLSDLKESGCINYRNNVKILSYYNNEINSNNIIKILTNSLIIKNTQHKVIKLTKLTQELKMQKVHFFKQYIFNCSINIQKLLLTYNHKYLSNKKWIQTNHTLKNTNIHSINQYNKKNSNDKQKIINTYINQIRFLTYSKSYDLSISNYFNFISQNIILHNSIEQDADIIMILNNKNNLSIEKENKKVLDITVCKNRNGPTGTCEIIFVPETTVFQNK
uniref:DNA 5'-3' helicase n=1 Tax=Dasyclonium flaccidum TaxID=2007274 RepID=A0A1Z1MKX6_9FLOR|nr:Replication helicase subunit [Dasyclonium flaccidum]ARW66708.1 Replication helicase subunit [Dasyclonium flaccidum]